MRATIQITQFPVNIANARTVHKLQGRTLDQLLVSNWSYTPSWIYVVLSRVRTSKSLYVRLPLEFVKTNTAQDMKYRKQIKIFHDLYRAEKMPKYFKDN